MRQIKRGRGGAWSAPDSKQETVCLDAQTPWAIAHAINDVIETMAVKVVAIHSFFFQMPAFPPEGLEELFMGHGPFYAIVVFEEDLPS